MLKARLLKFLLSFENLVRLQVYHTAPYFRVLVNKTASTAFTSLCVCRFLLQNVFFEEIINSFVSFVFILVYAFDFPVFWFYEDREITKKSSYLNRK